jgi:hypothetical protein
LAFPKLFTGEYHPPALVGRGRDRLFRDG